MINMALFCVLFLYFFKDTHTHKHLVNIMFESSFLIHGEDWIIIGNKKQDLALHQSITIDNKMSNYITAKDNLINVDWKNKDDKDLWYFKSPPIRLQSLEKNRRPFLLSFTMRSFAGDFKQLNYCNSIIKIRGKKATFIYPYVKKYDGKMETFNIPLLNELWVLDGSDTTNNILLESIFNDEFRIEILGDWTRGIEIIGLDNIQIL